MLCDVYNYTVGTNKTICVQAKRPLELHLTESLSFLMGLCDIFFTMLYEKLNVSTIASDKICAMLWWLILLLL